MQAPFDFAPSGKNGDILAPICGILGQKEPKNAQKEAKIRDLRLLIS
jgi:hypothetical protein